MNDKPPIYDYNTYKILFEKEILSKANVLEFATKELYIIDNYLTKRNDENLSLPNGRIKSINLFFEDLTNNNNDYQVDYSLLYDCYILNIGLDNDLYFYASHLIPTNQYKRFLTAHIQKLNQRENSGSSLNKSDSINNGFNLGLKDDQLIILHQALIDNKFLDNNTDIVHFKNAFNGLELATDYKSLNWSKSVYGAIFLKVNFDTDNKNLKVWQNAEKVFDNGSSDSLKNAFKNTDKHNDYYNKISQIMKSLPQFTVN